MHNPVNDGYRKLLVGEELAPFVEGAIDFLFILNTSYELSWSEKTDMSRSWMIPFG